MHNLTDDDRARLEEIAQILDAKAEWPACGAARADAAFLRKLAQQSSGDQGLRITDEMVERAARAPFDHAGSRTYWDRLDPKEKEVVREDARLMLSAALTDSTEDTTKGGDASASAERPHDSGRHVAGGASEGSGAPLPEAGWLEKSFDRARQNIEERPDHLKPKRYRAKLVECDNCLEDKPHVRWVGGEEGAYVCTDCQPLPEGEKCERCGGSGDDPEPEEETDAEGVPFPVRTPCRECNGRGTNPRERVVFKSNGHLGTVLERSHGLVWVHWDAASLAAGKRMDSWVQPDDIEPAPGTGKKPLPEAPGCGGES